MNEPSFIEIQNTDKVLDFLANIEEVSYTKMENRPDIFNIVGPGNISCILDVEETMVCISAEICDIPEDQAKANEILNYLMEQNFVAVHGKFATNNGKVFFKENLEFENLDGNELEAALAWTLKMVEIGAEKIVKIIR